MRRPAPAVPATPASSSADASSSPLPFVIAMLATAALAFYRTGQWDYWFHLAAGRSILTHGFPRVEIWCLAARGTPPWFGEWLFHVAIFGLHQLGSELAVGVWRMLWACAAVGAAWWIARRLDARPLLLLLLLPLALAVTRARQDPRPEQITLALWLFAVALFERARQGGRDHTAWLLVPQLAWSQMHAGWVLGPVTAWLYAAGSALAKDGRSRAWRWVLLGVGLVAVSAVTPRPWDTITLRDFREFGDASVRWVDELRPWTWATDRARPYTAWVALALVSLLLAGPRAWRRSPPLTLVGVAGLAAGIAAFRYQALAVLSSFPLVAAALATLDARPRAALVRGLAISAAVIGVVDLAIDLPHYAPGAGVVEAAVPIRAVSLAESLGLQGATLNTSWYGGYLLWARGERHPPLVDTRNLGGPAFQRQLARAATDPAALDSLQATYHFTHAVIQPPSETQDPLAIQLASRPDWTLIFADDAGLLFVRPEVEPELAARYGFHFLTPDYAVMAQRCALAVGDSAAERTLRRELARARASSPWHSRASLWLALLDLAEGRSRDAVRGFDEVERLAPLTPGLALRQGMARELSGDREGARAAYRRALREPADAATAKEALERVGR